MESTEISRLLAILYANLNAIIHYAEPDNHHGRTINGYVREAIAVVDELKAGINER